MHLSGRIRILVVHDDPVASAGLCAAFSQCGDFELAADDGSLGADSSMAIRHGPPDVDVIVADYSHGVSIAARAPRHPASARNPRVMVLASIDREWEIRSALECGVRGYILVGCSLSELADGVRAVHRGARHLSSQVAARLAESMSIEALTVREEAVLRLVVEGLCNKAIGRRLGIAVGTVKSHLKSAFDKLRVDSRTQAVAVVERRGILRQDSTPESAAHTRGVSTERPSSQAQV